MNSIMIYATSSSREEQVLKVKEQLDIPVIRSLEEVQEDSLLLQIDEEGIALRKGKLTMRGDYNTMLPRVLPGKLQHEKLWKAAKVKSMPEHPTAVDATAGMGEDALILAAAGFEIQLYEKDPVIGVLLQDTLERALKIPELTEIVERMHFKSGDSMEAMRQMAQSGHYPDLIYLDPMFPARSKSGLIKKKFQLLQQLESPCSDGEEMLHTAIEACPRKIIIKRPQKGELLGGMKPSYSIPGKAIRYDCLLFPR